MPRLKPVDPAKASGPVREMLDGLQAKLGKVPNVFRGLAASPAALGFYLGGAKALEACHLDAKVREQVALAVAQVNECDYCLAAHTALGKAAGLAEDEMLGARRGIGTDDRATAAVVLARKMVQARGDLTDADVANARRAGLKDADLAEVAAVVCHNLFTNYFNHLNGTEMDFPVPPKAS